MTLPTSFHERRAILDAARDLLSALRLLKLTRRRLHELIAQAMRGDESRRPRAAVLRVRALLTTAEHAEAEGGDDLTGVQ